jgi:hypothetical protein
LHSSGKSATKEELASLEAEKLEGVQAAQTDKSKRAAESCRT